uniref:Uncharacterized protein n=1 Tax=Strongyloides papillosus TaxID=174720 RepID=A0A0N5CIZ1_STREA
MAFNSVGFRYHCIGKAGKPPCFVDMIPWEDSYKKVFLKFFLKIDRDYFAHLQHKA